MVLWLFQLMGIFHRRLTQCLDYGNKPQFTPGVLPESTHTYLHNPKSTTAIWWLLPEAQAELHSFIQQTFHEHPLVPDRLSPSHWGHAAESDTVSIDIQLTRQLQQRELGVLWQETEGRVIAWVVLEPSWR